MISSLYAGLLIVIFASRVPLKSKATAHETRLRPFNTIHRSRNDSFSCAEIWKQHGSVFPRDAQKLKQHGAHSV